MIRTEQPRADSLCQTLHASGLESYYTNNDALCMLLTPQFEVVCMNRAACQAFQLTQHETTHAHFLDYVHPDDLITVTSELWAAANGDVVYTQARLILPLSPELATDLYMAPYTIDQGIVGVFVSAIDLSEQHQTQRLLTEAQSQFHAFYQSHPDPIFSLDLDGNFTHMNLAAQTFLGHSDTTFKDKHMIDFVLPELQAETRERFLQAITGSITRHETTFQLSDGRIVQLSISVIPIGDPTHPTGLHCIARDVTDERISHENLRIMAHTDSLTGLLNKYSFDHDLTMLIEQKAEFTLLIVDIDRLKNVNDTWGRTMGDRVLELATKRMLSHAPAGVTIYRYTGDQFFFIYLTDDLSATHTFAEQLNGVFDDPFHIDNHAVRTTVSIGAAHYPANADDAETLVTITEHAVNLAKKLGRNRFLWWSDIADPVHRENAELAVMLREAALNGELSLVYQPQIHLTNGKVFGVEALLRWNNPQFGQVPPDRFIKLAERSGLIVEIGAWALQRACEDFTSWQHQGLMVPHVSVNISMHQFQDRDFLQVISNALASTGVKSDQLVLEITESVAQTQQAALDRMLEVQQLGVKLALDDFGTGFSSFSAVHDLPLNFLKVDRIFVRYLEETRSSGLTTAVLDLANNLRLTSIVEGIETSEQLEKLQSLGAHIGQGFLISRPLSSEHLVAWLRDQNQRLSF